MSLAHPNILILCADHFRADTLSCLGHPVVRTPNLDALATRGTRFDRAYCMAPMCIPTRISMFTGLSPHTLNKVEHVRMPVDPRVQGLSHFMAKAGYQTGIIGKTHFWPPTETYGSDFVSLTIDRHLTEELGREDAYVEYLRALGLDGAREGDLPAEHYRTYWTAREAKGFLEVADERPFFLFCSFVKPHPPLDPPEPQRRLYDEAQIPLPCARESEWQTRPSVVRAAMARDCVEDVERREQDARRFYALTTMVDEGVGTVLEALDAVGQAENTVVLFTSDHGEFLGDHYLSGKEFFYDSSARVPFIVAGPGIAAGEVSDALVSHLDVTPTCIDLTAQPIPDRLEGRSLLPAAHDPQANLRDTLFGEMHKGYATPDGPWWSGQKMAIRGKWKYIYYSRAWEGMGREEELFDLASDPGEFTNLAAEHPEVCGELRDAILEWLVNTEENRVYPVDDRYPLTRVERPQIPPTNKPQ